MKKFLAVVVAIVLFSGGLNPISAQQGKGGFEPCLATCFLGPRVGLEINEGIPIQTEEWIRFGAGYVGAAVPVIGPGISAAGHFYAAYQLSGKKNGFSGFLASLFIGPRVGQQLDYRYIRTKEWLLLVPCVNLYPAISIPLEAYDGKTMTGIAREENLSRY